MMKIRIYDPVKCYLCATKIDKILADCKTESVHCTFILMDLVQMDDGCKRLNGWLARSLFLLSFHIRIQSA